MGYDPRSAAVIVCCIAAILVAATLFPTAGIGGPASDFGPGAASDASTSDGPRSDESGGITGGTADSGGGGDGEGEGSESGETDSTDGGSGESVSTDGGSGATDPDSDGADSSSGTDESDSSGTEPSDTDSTGADGFGSETLGLIFSLKGLIPVLVIVGLLAAIWRWVPRSASRKRGGDGTLPDGRLPRLRMRLSRIPQLTMVITIAVGRRALTVGSGFAALGGSLAAAVRVGGTGFRTALASVSTFSIALPSIPRAWPFDLSTGDQPSRVRSDSGPQSASCSTDEASTSDDDHYTDPETVEEAWRRLVSSLAVHRQSVRTPRECASIAIDAGLPRDAVETVTDSFEATRYGNAPRTPDRLERVREAYDRIRRTREGDDR